MIEGGDHVFVRHLQLQLPAGAVKAGDAELGDGVFLAVDKGDAPVPQGVDVADQFPHTLNIVRLDGAAVLKDIVDGHHRDAAVHQFQHLGVIEFH